MFKDKFGGQGKAVVEDILGVGIEDVGGVIVGGLGVMAGHIESQSIRAVVKHSVDIVKAIGHGVSTLMIIKITGGNDNIKNFVKRSFKIVTGLEAETGVMVTSFGNKFRNKVDTQITKIGGIFLNVGNKITKAAANIKNRLAIKIETTNNLLKTDITRLLVGPLKRTRIITKTAIGTAVVTEAVGEGMHRKLWNYKVVIRKEEGEKRKESNIGDVKFFVKFILIDLLLEFFEADHFAVKQMTVSIIKQIKETSRALL